MRLTDVLRTPSSRGTGPARVDAYLRQQQQDRPDAAVELSAKYFDLVTTFYEYGWGQHFHFAPRWRGESFHASLLRHEQFLALQLRLDGTQRVLDVGCGVGGPMRSIARLTDCHITGITIDPYQVSRARTLNAAAGLAARCQVIEGDFTAMALADASLDAAYAIEASVHAPDLAGLYREIRRVLKPGGLFASYEWCLTPRFDPDDPAQRELRREIEIGSGIAGIPAPADIARACAAAGLDLLRCEDRGSNLDIPWWEPLAPTNLSWATLRSSRPGRQITRWALRLLEPAGLVPKGSTAVEAVLNRAGQGLIAAGRTGIFTPAYFVLARRPE